MLLQSFGLGIYCIKYPSAIIIFIYILYRWKNIYLLIPFVLGTIYPYRIIKTQYICGQVVEVEPRHYYIYTNWRVLKVLRQTKYNNFQPNIGDIMTGKVVEYCGYPKIYNPKIIKNTKLPFMFQLRSFITKFGFISDLLCITSYYGDYQFKSVFTLLFIYGVYKATLHLLAFFPYVYYRVDTERISLVVSILLGFSLYILQLCPFTSGRIILFFIINKLLFIPNWCLLDVVFGAMLLYDASIIFNRGFLGAYMALYLIYQRYNYQWLSIFSGKFNFIRVIISFLPYNIIFILSTIISTLFYIFQYKLPLVNVNIHIPEPILYILIVYFLERSNEDTPFALI